MRRVKATPPELVLPLTLGKSCQILGDPNSCQAMIDEKEFGEALEAVGAKKAYWGLDTKDDYKVSQFEKVI